MRLIECVPNFSDGRNQNVIEAIASAIRHCEGVSLLNIDPGVATNRTVMTFVGEPEKVVEAAFQAVRKASELIDMRHHTGAHPRIGATDVLPLVPLSGVTLEECAEMARALARRISHELGIPTYNYEAAASCEARRNLADVRSGEYEGLEAKLQDPAWKPDFGKAEFTEQAARSGATIVGARDFLVAVNYNLNTTSTRRANAIAFDVREKGRIVDGEQIAGTLKDCKAIGWFIDEYGVAQVSMNIVNINTTPLHIAFEEVCRAAGARGIRVTGTEIVGLVPLRVLTEAGRYFLERQERSTGVGDDELVRIACLSMGLSEISQFKPRERVIEYLIEDHTKKRLVEMSCRAFAIETASESAAPGGGSISAYMGALGAALGTMVANLSSHKKGWDERWNYFSDYAERGQKLMKELLALVDEDTAAFNRIMDCFAMPKGTPQEKELRSKALQAATLYATEVPLRTMRVSYEVFDIVETMAGEGNPNSVSDAGVGALAARSAVLGAGLNVKINASGLKDKELAAKLVGEAEQIAANAARREEQVLKIVNEKI
ncbi:Glutamate formiminotransferase/Glutamate formyltransferase [Mucinivorans hirudinis]|uniref:Formimidoyltransferase-cyclodeaminase n=1 Tax=Mucinivorans hirudinis TaxID=1433126 RepID=A0A060R6X4_9BACT|nr:Glutamate formiminotransferase/Glutamate formyltransferase [Mucinivorans hirudinis]